MASTADCKEGLEVMSHVMGTRPGLAVQAVVSAEVRRLRMYTVDAPAELEGS